MARTDDEDTLAFVEDWLDRAREKMLGAEADDMIATPTVGIGGREVAAMFALQPPKAAQKVLGDDDAPDDESEFQRSMRDLAGQLTVQADELEKAALF